jgi:hypothetical protein
MAAALLPFGEYFETVQFCTVETRWLVLRLPAFRKISMMSAEPEMVLAVCGGPGIVRDWAAVESGTRNWSQNGKAH